MKRKITFLVLLFVFISLNNKVFSQASSANYTFMSVTNGFLTDMSTGATELFGANSSTTALGRNSTLQNIGFDFYFMGVKYSQYSINSRGILKLGTTVYSGVSNPNDLNSTANLPLFAPFWANMRTSDPNGSARFKVTGSMPNRVLIVEWSNMSIAITGSTTADGTFQIRLYETTGKIEYVYGSMNIGSGSPNVVASIGFTNGNTNNNLVSITNIASPAVTTMIASVNNSLINSSTPGPIVGLNSSFDGSRVVYSFTPPVPTPPTNLSFTNVTGGAMTLNWTDGLNELLYYIYNSTDGINYNFVTSVPANSTSTNILGLNPNTNYFWRIYSLSEGAFSMPLEGNQSTNPGSISGTKTIGATGNYFTLQSAFNDINSNGLNGNTIIELQADYNPLLETYPIKPGYLSGSSESNSVIVRPANGVTGKIFNSDSLQVFDLNTTKYLIIDGRPGGNGTSQEITINSINTSGNAIRFINDANNNIIKFCKITGVNTSISNGIIFQSTTVFSNGNDNNTIDNCEIRDGSSVPAILIYNSGILGINNDNFIISNCRLFNFSRSGFETSANGTGSNYTFSNNSIYQSSSPPVGVTSSTNFRGISILGNGTGHTITGNYIGGQEMNCGGNPFLKTGNLNFRGIVLSLSVGSAFIQNNTIQNINLAGTGNINFAAIEASPNIQLIENIIGHNLNLNSITSAAGSGSIVSIDVYSQGSNLIENNIIANISLTNLAGSASITGIRIKDQSMGISLIVENNFIHGLYSSALVTNQNPGACAITGIYSAAPQTGQIIRNNSIYNLEDISTGNANVVVMGIGMETATGQGEVCKNKIYNLTNKALGVAPSIYGVYASNGSWNIINNQISLNNGLNNNPLIIGGIGMNINNVNAIWNIYYNSIYIGGTASSGSLTSKCIYKQSTNVINSQNNIFYNERTGGTGAHYAVDFSNSTNITSDYNLLIGASSTIAKWGASTYNFADYKTNSGKDGFSYSNQPANVLANNLFIDKSVGNLNILSANNEAFYADGKGIPISGISGDYTDSSGVRNTLITQGTTDIGSDEFAYAGTIPNLTESAPPALGTITTYSFGGRQLASITWANVGTVPTGISISYYSGINPPGTEGVGTDQYSKAYWDITATGGSGYTYDITLNYSPAILFNIVNESNLKIAKRDGMWTYLSGATVNTTTKTVTATGLNSFSQFALTSSDAPLPVELASFNSLTIRNEVILDWSTVFEINNALFEIERSQATISDNYVKIGSIQGSGTTNEITKYQFTDRNVQTGKYKYRLKQIDFNGNFQYFNLSNEVEVGIPSKYDLSQNYPNPFNPVTKINYDIPKDGKVNLRIYDITGKEVASLINTEVQPAGYYTITFNASNLSSGIYFYRLVTENFVSTKKLVLLK